MRSLTMINRTHTVNTNYFHNIDNPEKAYWLGFLWADGNIQRTSPRSSGPNRLRIAQKWSERHHLEKFKTAICADYPIKPISHPGNNTVAQLDINCRPLCSDLQKLGYDVKTKRIRIPDIQPELISHFIRGYFDGNGGLSLYTQKIKQWTVYKQEWSITGEKHLMTEIKTILTENADVTADVKLKSYKKSPTVASVRYGKKSDIANLYAYLYKDATVYLESKHQKFVDFFSRYAS